MCCLLLVGRFMGDLVARIDGFAESNLHGSNFVSWLRTDSKAAAANPETF